MAVDYFGLVEIDHRHPGPFNDEEAIVALTELPITPQKILEALKERESSD